jgi:hypothetical protein
MADVTQALLARYQSKRTERASVPEPPPHPQLRSYRHAAAVLHRFTPETLSPADDEPQHESPRLLLFDDIVRVPGEWEDRLFTLKPEVRKNALRELSTREAMREALGANPDRVRTRVQQMWEEYLESGSIPDPETLGYRQLTNLCQILSWLDGLDPDLPPQETVLDLVRRRSVLASFEHLVADNFTGRVKELAMLREHLEALPVATGFQAVRLQLEAWLKTIRKPILAIYGPGGIGKSALIGRLLWEHSQAEPDARIPFAYLAFDQPTLRVETPFTLLVEAVAQFELQAPEHADSVEKFHESVRAFRDAKGALGDRSEEQLSRRGRINEVRKLDNDLYRDFAALMRTVGARTLDGSPVHVPVLLVLDTFEEVQYRDRESLAGFWRMLDTLQKAYPPLRVIISGRGPISGLGVDAGNIREVLLEALEPEDRVMLLQRLGVEDPSVARTVAEQVGGSPLSLLLAANVITKDPEAAGSKGISGLTTRKWLFFQVDEQIIQGQLYRRILDHIHNKNVRALAHPGMVLRRVTPDVILEVLAPLCLPMVKDLDEATLLFEELRREHALVLVGDDGALVYRPEIRRAMIRLLQQDRYGDVRALHRAAIKFYQAGDDVTARAEEIYHRLVLGEDELWQIDSRWMTGIESSIVANVEEYPDRLKAWLASRMNLEVPRSVFANASTADWERNTTRKVQSALSELNTEWALSLLGERSDRTDASPLFALEAKTHLLRNDLQSASVALERGIEHVSTSTNRGRLAELFWLESQVALLRDDSQAGDRALERAEKAIENASNPIPLTHILCHRLLVRRGETDRYRDVGEIRARLNTVCERIDENTAYSAPYVVRLALDVLENEFPKTTARLGPLVQPEAQTSTGDPLTSENLQGLDEYREAWELENILPPEAAV